MVCCWLLGAMAPSLLVAQPPSEEAIRSFNRGMAAVEMATDVEDYALAIEEFQKAQALAPDWPDIYYNLGMIQERAGKFHAAVASWRTYVQLAPNAPDVDAVRTLIDKTEFKAEQSLSDEDVLEILVSLTDGSRWQIRGLSNANLFNQDKWVKSMTKIGQGEVRVVFPSGTCGNGVGDNRAMLNGKGLDFGTYYCLCEVSTDKEMCVEVRRYWLQVVSRRKVTMKMRYWYPKIFGGGTDDATLEFVRR